MRKKRTENLINGLMASLALAGVLALTGCGGGNAAPAFQIPADPRGVGQADLESLFGQISARRREPIHR